MKTAEQIADEAMRAFTLIESDRFEDGTSDVEERSAPYIREQIIAAVEDDRAQLREKFESRIIDSLEAIDLSVEALTMEEVFEARDGAHELLSSILATLNGQEQ